MKIAFFHQLNKGGARRATNEFAQHLKKLGHRVDLFTIDTGQENEERLFYSEINYYKFSSRKWSGHDWKTRLYKDTIELIKVCLLDKKIAKDIEGGSYDLAFVSASDFIESPFILRFLTIPKIFYCHDPYYRMIYEEDLFNRDRISRIKLFYERINRFIRKHIDRWNIKKADYIIFNSKYTKNSFEKVYGKTGSVSYIGINTSYFTPSKIKRDVDLLYIGSREFVDGYSLFNKALSKINPDIRVREVLSEKEWLSDNQLRNLYRKSKILVATAFREPLGLVPLEAMACGMTVVAVNEGAHKETVINGKTGFIVENDSNKIANRIDWLLHNPKIIEKMGKQARDYTERTWNWEKRGKELEVLLLKILKDNL